MSFLGFVQAAATIGLGSIQIRPKRQIGPFTAYVVLEEVHRDVLEITQHPVEQGAAVADHAYIRPAELTIKAGWSDSPQFSGLFTGILKAASTTVEGIQSLVTGNNVSQVRDVYAKLLKLQADRIPFDVLTGKRSYSNMLVRALTVVTDKQSENSLMVTCELQQVILVSTTTVTIKPVAPSDQKNPQSSQPVVGQGLKGLLPGPTFNSVVAPAVKAGMYIFKGTP